MFISKSESIHIYRTIFSFLLLSVFVSIGHSQNKLIRGFIYDQNNKDPLPYATISIIGTSHGTISNNDGYFEYRSIKGNYPIRINVSYIGYEDSSFIIQNDSISNYNLILQHNILPDILVRENFEKYLIKKAWEKRNHNYPNTPSKTRGFMRQSVWKDNQIMYLGEALIDTYKSSYQYAKNDNQIELIKFRKYSNDQNYQDSLSLYGAPFLVYGLDFVKKKMPFLNPHKNEHYVYKYTDNISFQHSNHYKLKFKSVEDSISGYFLINDEDYAITYIEYNNNKAAVSENRFYKNKHHVSVSYRKTKSRYTLNKLVSTVKFTNKISKNELDLQIEYATTDTKTTNCQAIPFDKTISYNSIFMNNDRNSDHLNWEQYTIIAASKKIIDFIANNEIKNINTTSHWAQMFAAFSFEIGSGYNYVNKRNLPNLLQSRNSLNNDIPLILGGLSSITSYFSIGFNLNKHYSINFSSTRDHLFGSIYKSNSWIIKHKYRLTIIGSPLFLDAGIGYSFVQISTQTSEKEQKYITSIKSKQDAISLNLQLSYALNKNLYLVLTGNGNYLINQKTDIQFNSAENRNNYNVVFPSKNLLTDLNLQLKLGIRYYLKSLF